jgi:hypothetical protein
MNNLNEDFLTYIWQFQLFDKNIQTSDGHILQVIQAGERNHDSGPDFFNARIKIWNTTWAGNVEIHINASDWYKHKHQNDQAYDNIILHVVLNEDETVYRKNNEKIPTLVLNQRFNESILEKYTLFMESKKWIPCEELIGSVNYFEINNFLDALMTERIEQKSDFIIDELKHLKLDFREVFYRKLARNFGFKTNSAPFELLAKSLPLNILSKHKNNLIQIEALLFGQAGLLEGSFKDSHPRLLKREYSFLSKKYQLEPLNKKLWKFMRLRPANFPTIRIAQFAKILYKSSAELTNLLEAEKLSEIINLFRIETCEYWKDHYRFDTKTEVRKKVLGVSSINLILINTIIPFLFVYGQHRSNEQLQQKALTWLEQIKAENNHIVNRFKAVGIKPQNAMQSQALLQLKSNYCNNKRCLECRIGHRLLKES